MSQNPPAGAPPRPGAEDLDTVGAMGNRVYKSAGTISVQSRMKNGQPELTIFFVPDSYHFVRDAEKSYAIFVPCDNESPSYPNSCAVECDEKDPRIEVKDKPRAFETAVMSAAASQCRAEVNIKAIDEHEFTLAGITIPAPDK